MENVQCDECHGHFKVNLKQKKHGNGVIETYFTCRHCDKHYTSFVTNARARRMQRTISKLYKSINIHDIESFQNKQREIEQEKQKLKQLMDELKNKYGRS